jgi:hypothetical protein
MKLLFKYCYFASVLFIIGFINIFISITYGSKLDFFLKNHHRIQSIYYFLSRILFWFWYLNIFTLFIAGIILLFKKTFFPYNLIFIVISVFGFLYGRFVIGDAL